MDISQQIQNVQDEIAQLEKMPADKLVAEVQFDETTKEYIPQSEPTEYIPASEMLARLRQRLAGLQPNEFNLQHP